MKINTELLTQDNLDLVKSFSSGNGFLDNFLRSADALNDNIGKTFVWVNEKRTGIIGYYNMGVGYIDTYEGDDKYKVGGSIHLNFFALDSAYRGIVVAVRPDGTKIKVSDQLFADFMKKVYKLREESIGFAFITLAATDEGYSLYKRNQFEDLEADLHFSLKDDEKGCRPMYLALDYEI